MIICSNCGLENPENATICNRCLYPIEVLDEFQKKGEELLKQTKLKKQKKPLQITEETDNLLINSRNVLISTTPTIQGKIISQYLDIAFSSIILGPNFFSDNVIGYDDLSTFKTNLYKDKLSSAIEYLVNELKVQTLKLEGNGIVNLNLEFSSLFGDKTLVCGIGTIVKITNSEKLY